MYKNTEFDIEVVKRIKNNVFIGFNAGLFNTHNGIWLAKCIPVPFDLIGLEFLRGLNPKQTLEDIWKGQKYTHCCRSGIKLKRLVPPKPINL